MKEEKILNILTVIVIIILLGYYIITNSIPNYKKTFGSSDKLINTNNYVNLINMNVNNNINVGFILNDKKQIYHIYFYDDNSMIFYNKNIENNTLNKSMDIIITRLIEEDYLKEKSTITLTKYDKKYYTDFKDSLNKILKKYKVNVYLKEKQSDLLTLGKDLEIDNTDRDKILLEIDLLLKSQVNTKEEKEEVKLTEKDIKKYCNNIYMNIEKYMTDNNIKNEEKNNTKLDIKTITADSNSSIFPDKESYYYIKDSKVYAYIKITIDAKSKDYCYNGSIDEYKVGAC